MSVSKHTENNTDYSISPAKSKLKELIIKQVGFNNSEICIKANVLTTALFDNNQVLKVLVSTAQDFLLKTTISKNNKKQIFGKFLVQFFKSNIQKIMLSFEPYLLSENSEHFFSDNPGLIEDLFKDDPEAINQTLDDFKNNIVMLESSGRVNTCIEFDSSRRMRRFDSLAKLLNLDGAHSVCSAISIYKNQLILSGNISLTGEILPIRNNLSLRMDLIRHFFKQMLAMDSKINLFSSSSEIDNEDILNSTFSSNEDLASIREHYSPEYMAIYDDFYTRLKPLGGIFQKDIIIFQAFTKLYLSLLFKQSIPNEIEDDLTENDCGIILDGDLVILLPAKPEESENYQLAVFDKDGCQYVPFQGDITNHHINHFHAEQLIAFYILWQNDGSLSPDSHHKIPIGISKPTCIVCESQLGQFGLFTTRGSSRAAFDNTAEILATTRKYSETVSETKNPSTPPQKSKKVKKTTYESPYTNLIEPQKSRPVTYLQSSPGISPEFIRTLQKAQTSKNPGIAIKFSEDDFEVRKDWAP